MDGSTNQSRLLLSHFSGDTPLSRRGTNEGLLGGRVSCQGFYGRLLIPRLTNRETGVKTRFETVPIKKGPPFQGRLNLRMTTLIRPKDSFPTREDLKVVAS